MQSTLGSRPEVSLFSSPNSVQFLLSFHYILQIPRPWLWNQGIRRCWYFSYAK